MRKVILQLVKATFPILAGLSIFTCYGQQSAVPTEQTVRATPDNYPAAIFFPVASAFNGYNEIQWTAKAEQQTRKFIVEYSSNGIDFLTAGEALAGKEQYSPKHYILETRPLLYRVRTETLNGRSFYSTLFLLLGEAVLPVRIYPTIITGNVINLVALLPVERVMIFSSAGQQVAAKDLNGIMDHSTVSIPTLNKGIYFATFYGRGWKSTSKFVVGNEYAFK